MQSSRFSSFHLNSLLIYWNKFNDINRAAYGHNLCMIDMEILASVLSINSTDQWKFTLKFRVWINDVLFVNRWKATRTVQCVQMSIEKSQTFLLSRCAYLDTKHAYNKYARFVKKALWIYEEKWMDIEKICKPPRWWRVIRSQLISLKF